MDHVKTNRKRKFPVNTSSLVAVLVTAAIIVVIASLDFGTQRIDRNAVQVDTVQRGDLTIDIVANGMLVPKRLEWVSAQVEGRVAIVHKRAGDFVKAGDILLEMNNPSVVAEAEEALSALEGAKAERLSFSVELENQLLNQKAVTIQSKFDYESAKLKLDAESELRKRSNIIADIDFRRTQLEVEQLKARHAIEKERLAKSQHNVAAQLAAKDSYVTQLMKALDRTNSKVSALLVKAGMSGIVQEMNIEIGQRLLPGSEIARLAQQDELYAELKVLARQASDITVGQSVLIDTRNGTVNGTVSRIDPAVTQGTVIVDVQIAGSLPKGARPELQVEGTITITELTDALFVGKPSYSKVDSEVSVYRLEPEGDYAHRVVFQAGKASTNNIQVVDGLSVGDKIILSDSSDWQQHERIIID